MNDKHISIQICGGIGSGKTTLAGLIQKNFKNYICLFENFALNPFFKDFYENPIKYSFETEITFLLQHYNLIKKGKDKENSVVYDFALIQDHAFSQVTLKAEKRKIFNQILNEIIKETGNPDILIYLKCPVQILLKRIKNRGRESEMEIDENYLLDVQKAIKNNIKSMKKTIVMEINSEVNNFAKELTVQKTILTMINNKANLIH